MRLVSHADVASEPEIIRLTAPSQLPIRELASMIAKAHDFTGEIKFDTSRSDGQLKKVRLTPFCRLVPSC